MKKTFTLFLTIIMINGFAMVPMSSGENLIKEPNVSGAFYDANADKLSRQIDMFMKKAKVPAIDEHIDIIIAPHAGYYYSGQVAGYSFKAVADKTYNTIVILAPSHYYGFDGVAIWEEGGFKTPLGVVNVDHEFSKALNDSHEKFSFKREVFEQEHSLEVEIPFIQKTFPKATIVPVIMGQPSFELLSEFAQHLKDVIGERKDVLIVVSTDMSHYHDDATARKMDHRTLEALKKQEVAKIFKECQLRTMEMCGCVPVTAALLYAKLKGLKNVNVLNYANSGDVSGDKERVVGYSSVFIHNGNNKNNESNDESVFSLEQKRRLIEIAKRTIIEYVANGKKMDFDEPDERLKQKEGAFVTIHKHGALRGCIGNIVGNQPLYKTVRDMAISASSHDPRFKPVSKDELKEIDVEVSVLSKPKRVKSADDIVMGKHGVILSDGKSHYGVFLPQVATETGWTKEEFLSELSSQKAGLARDAWKDPSTILEVFTADVFSEKDVR